MAERSDYPPDEMRLAIDAPHVDATDVADRLTGIATITNTETAEIVADVLGACVQLRAKIAATFDPHIARAFAAHRELLREKRDAENETARIEQRARDLLSVWVAAERARVNAERLDADRDRDDEVVALTAELDAAEQAGDFAAAEHVRDEIASLPPAAITPAALPTGISARETWSARVDDLGALVRAAAGHAPWIALLKPDMVALNAQARSLRSRLAIPGVSAVKTTGVASRSGK
jgi:hypothetical protein